ncbi:MAG: hypothetical protein JO283_12475 [Bradyrhizobium sp.]|jgi:tetrahydromethanopterin S-methyltransferase subunit G|nr:hypothetical protein [Bradyrhizobium sp.]
MGDPDNIEGLRAIRERLDRIDERLTSNDARLRSLEQHMKAGHLAVQLLTGRTIIVNVRLDRIEKRLGLIEVEP